MVQNRLASDQQLKFLFQALADQQTPQQVKDLLQDLCTIREINDMASRLAVAQMLAAGESYLKIQEITGTSATTIARVSKCLSFGAGGYQRVLGLSQSQPSQ